MINFVALPAPMVTRLDPVAPPVVAVAVNVPFPVLPVKIRVLATLATPLTKSPAPLSLFVPDKPVMLPVKLDVTVTLFVAALKPVTVFP
ncbi:hypothetical protein AQBE111736_14040 [Aquirufa beregesia]